MTEATIQLAYLAGRLILRLCIGLYRIRLLVKALLVALYQALYLLSSTSTSLYV